MWNAKIILIAIVLFTAASCQKQPAPAGQHGASQRGAGQHAPSNAVPGSHEDWCGEHQVAESLCTRCNPSLTAAFKATGDWCKEHGLPESQCLLCNPKLKLQRPPKAGGK